MFEIERIIPHSSSSVTLRFSSTLNEARQRVLGIQNVHVNLDVLRAAAAAVSARPCTESSATASAFRNHS